MPAFEWYETVNGESLFQGDIFRGFPIFIPNLASVDINNIGVDIPLEQQNTDVVVLTQSCDLAHDKVDSVILCPIWDLDKYIKNGGFGVNAGLKEADKIRKGEHAHVHMLNKANNTGQFLVVEFRRIFTTPKSVLRSFAASQADRLRLLPPYREHLSQAFARYFMRVGLPTDIPSFT